jgi:F0F1-type ATP synthase assembly protein I
MGLAPGVTLAGVLCLMAGVAAISHGGIARLTVGNLVSIAVVLVAGFLIGRYKHWLVRGTSPWRLIALYALGFAAFSIAPVAFGQVALRTSAWPLIVVGVLLFVLGWRQVVRMSDKAADRLRVFDPRTGDGVMSRQRHLPKVTRWAIPTILLLGLFLAVLLPAR